MLFKDKDFIHLIFFYTHFGPILIYIIIYHDYSKYSNYEISMK